MNMLKKNGGFTLVELIVVIAILAILAGIAVPAYSGYIEKANDAAVQTELGAIKTAAIAANAVAGEIGKIEINTDGTEITVTGVSTTTGEGQDATTTVAELADNYDKDFVTYYTVAAQKDANDSNDGVFTVTGGIDGWADSSYSGVGATWENGKWTAVEEDGE